MALYKPGRGEAEGQSRRERREGKPFL
uniref:Uncharacterized protein n=1 Tax=Anguilla anguilla TaxID=7936 RepID=A0A0E9PP26_ANGAN